MSWPAWLTLDFYKGIWDDFVEFLSDLPITILKGILDAVAGILELLPAPSFLSSGGLGDALGPAMPYIGYFLERSGFGEAVGLITLAVVFRLTRKAVTLGRW